MFTCNYYQENEKENDETEDKNLENTSKVEVPVNHGIFSSEFISQYFLNSN